MGEDDSSGLDMVSFRCQKAEFSMLKSEGQMGGGGQTCSQREVAQKGQK